MEEEKKRYDYFIRLFCCKNGSYNSSNTFLKIMFHITHEYFSCNGIYMKLF